MSKVKLDWKVPQTEWERFRQYVENKFGSIEGYLGRESEHAMREYIDGDSYNKIEEQIDRLIEATGRTPDRCFVEIKSGVVNQQRTRVTIRVEESVKDEFRSQADATDQDQSYGVLFAQAIRVRREGGRADRLERKLNRVIKDAESVLSEFDENKKR